MSAAVNQYIAEALYGLGCNSRKWVEVCVRGQVGGVANQRGKEGRGQSWWRYSKTRGFYHSREQSDKPWGRKQNWPERRGMEQRPPGGEMW